MWGNQPSFEATHNANIPSMSGVENFQHDFAIRFHRLEIEAQQARVRAIEVEVKYALEEVSSQQGLSEQGFSAGHELREAQLRAGRGKEELAEARRLAHRLEIHFTPKHGSWLNIAEIELSAAKFTLAIISMSSLTSGMVL